MTTYDVVIVGAGVAGNLMALELGKAGKKVLILEAGLGVPDNRAGYMDNFYLSLAKTPESPYPPLPGNGAGGKPLFPLPDPATEAAPRATVLMIGKKPDQSYLVQDTHGSVSNPQGTAVRGLPFASTYERVAGGTGWHWLGTSLRLVPHDLTMQSTYHQFTDWPVAYDELSQLYGEAEAAIGVSASVAQQAPLESAIGLTYPPGYAYPMGPIPTSMVDQAVSTGIGTMMIAPDAPAHPEQYPVFVTPTPAGRNSEPYQDRRVCAGNTNCIPICPIQAKWDPTVTLGAALDTGNVTILNQAVAVDVKVDAQNHVVGIDYLSWTKGEGGKIQSKPGTAIGTTYVLAAHAIENAKLLLMSNGKQGVANRSDQVGRNLMDHVLYLSWALSDKPLFGYRGPLSTAGIESLRDGAFRSFRAAFRMEIGNEGWNFAIGDPYTSATDFINGLNFSGQNAGNQRLGGLALVQKLNEIYTRQFRIACLFDQAPQPDNRITLDPTLTDGLGLPRPKIAYGLDDYTLQGFKAARTVCSAIYREMGATEFTTDQAKSVADHVPGFFAFDGFNYQLYGAGHIMGTHRMGTDPDTSVVDGNQRSHDCENLWIVGSGSFPTVGTANPTLTIAALAIKSARDILSKL
ncbi:MAG TPA: GMC family oxidoreductase [Kofleriaceae bacterium]|nr:GMC family oxidoreductase [Kofleriaceae bacterium]